MSVDSPLVGRGREISAIETALRPDAANGLLVVAGEAGVGKSTVVDAAVDRAHAWGQVVVRGWCLDLWEKLPFLPIVDALRDLSRHDALMKAAIARCPAYVEAAVAVLLPDLDIATDATVRDSSTVEGWHRERLFSAIAQLLRHTAGLGPVAMVLEDVHWADPSTQDLLRYLVARPHATGVPIIVTTRVEGTDSSWVEELENSGRSQRLNLEALNRSETGELVAALAVRSPGEINRIFDRSGGNPLFIEHLAAAEVDAGVPTSLAGLLTNRLDDLPGLEVDLVRALAVVGRPLDDVALGALVNRPPHEVADALRSLTSRRLVEHVGTRDHQLHHALLAEAVRAQTTSAEAQAIHRRAAEVLAERGDPAIAAAVADHYEAVGNRAAEARWRLAAARYADSVAAPVEASRQWRRLIGITRDTEEIIEALDLTLVDLYLRTFSALERSNEGLAAAGLAEEALARLTPSIGPAEQVRVYYEVGRWRQITDPRHAAELLQHAITVGEKLTPSPEYLRAVHQFVSVSNQLEAGNYPSQTVVIERALRAATEAGLVAEQKLLTAALAWRAMAEAEREHALELIDLAMGVTIDSPDPWVEVLTAVYATDIMLKFGMLDRVVAAGAAALSAAESSGYPDSFTTLLVASNTVEALREQGRTSDLARFVITAGTPLTRSTVVAYSDLAGLRLAEGDLTGAARFWDDLSALLPDWGLQFDREFRLLHDEFLLWADRAGEVGPDALEVLRPLSRTEESALAGGLFVLAMRACADRAVAARMTSDGVGAAAAVRDAHELDAVVDDCITDPFADRTMPITALADGASWRAERARVAGTQDAAAWAEAATRWTDLGRPHRAAYALWRQAEALLADPYGRPAARPVLLAATEAAREHVPLTEAIAALADRAHIALSAPPQTSPPSAQLPFGLTEREIAVIRLLGQGRTNGEIATALFISPKTASVHVSNILRKLQVTSRVQAAAIAAQTGLLDD